MLFITLASDDFDLTLRFRKDLGCSKRNLEIANKELSYERLEALLTDIRCHAELSQLREAIGGSECSFKL